MRSMQRCFSNCKANQARLFDTAYIQGQIVGHQQLLNIQQTFLNSILTGNDDEHIAVLARVVIQMHLTMLQELQMEITA